MSQAAAVPMRVRLAVRMTSSDSFSCRSTTPSSSHFAKYACIEHMNYCSTNGFEEWQLAVDETSARCFAVSYSMS